jgi:D-alanyl-D-alanine endopeptidase (penicillin-binding protein 7)
MRRILSLLVFLALLHNGQSSAATTKPVPITASSWLVADGEGRVIESVNADQPRSIASITKLMTAMIVLDANQDLGEKIKNYTRTEWLQLMLVKSDNHAAEVLCENYPTGRAGCIGAMNWKAYSLGLHNTHYADPSGLNVMNVSTAQELVKLVMTASSYPEIVKASNIAHGKITKTIKKKSHYYTFNNTNPLVATTEFIVTKTGYIRASGGCIVMMLDTKIGRRIVVLLNSKNTRTRIPEANQLAMSF